MIMVLIFVLVVILFLAAGVEEHRARPSARRPADIADADPVELAINDPVEALRRFGVSEDAERLADQDIDLGDLGLRGKD